MNKSGVASLLAGVTASLLAGCVLPEGTEQRAGQAVPHVEKG